MTEHLEPAIDRWSTWILSALVVLTAIAFFPDLASPFFAAKSLVFFLGVALLFAVALFRGSRLFPIDPASRRLALCLVAFACLALISTVASRWRYMSPNTVAWYLACLVLCWTGTLLSHRHLSSFLKCIAVAGSLVAAAALAQALIGHDFLFPLFGRSAQLFAGRMRLFSTLGNPNFVATYIAACCPAILAFGLRSSRLRQLAAFTWLCVLIAVVIMTGSRAGLLALIAGLSASLLMGPIPRRTSVLSIAIGLLLLLSLAHFSNRNPRSIGDSFAGRSLIWRATLSDSWFRPLGTGPGTFAYLYPSRVGSLLTQSADADTQRFAGREEHALNDWVELWSDLGPLAPILLIVLVVLFVKALTRPAASERSSSRAVIAGIVAALITASFFDFPLYRPETAVLFWLALGMALATDPAAAPRRAASSTLRWSLALVILAAGLFFAITPTIASYYTQRGRKAEMHYPATAYAFYDRALLWDPAQTDARFGRMKMLTFLQMYPDAFAANTDLLAWVCEPEVWVYRSQIAHTMNDDALALAQLRIGLAQFPYSKALQQELARFGENSTR